MHFYWIFVLATLAVVPLVGYAARPSPHWDDMRLQHSWSAVPGDWEHSGPPPTSTTIDLYVALMPLRKNALIQALNEVSSPGHPKYGAYLSREQVADLVAPHSDTLKLVHSWLEYCGVPSSSVSVTHSGSSLKLTAVSTSLANLLLGASYQSYRHVKTNETIVRTLGYALPTALGGHVQTVAPTTSFDFPRKQWQKPRKRFGEPAVKPAEGEPPGQPVSVSSSRDDEFGPATPALLSWLYGTWDYSPLTEEGVNRIGFVGFLGEYPSEKDLSLFMQNYHAKGLDATFTVSQVNGGVHDPEDGPNLEADMNMQYSQGMAYPTEHIFYSSGRGPSGTKDYYGTWLEYILEQDDIPQTISIPYVNDERVYSREYTEVVCDQLARLGARGVSVLVPSGDSAVGGEDCFNEHNLVRFVPNFPASCPYVTSVGGTKNYFPEVAASFSSGGFSNYFSRPDYQQEAVTSFLQVETLENLLGGLYNESGRGMPDIAAQAWDFRMFFNDVFFHGSGTSGSTAIVAGIISLLNDYLISEGKPPLGFLNPWLYGVGLGGITDIKYGSNPGCFTGGFAATEGWDPVTGLGTLTFLELQSILKHTVVAQPTNPAN